MFAEIILNASAKQLNRVFDYCIPQKLENTIKIGNRVLVPFGNSKRSKEGFVVKIKNESSFANKDIISILDDGISEENMKLAQFMSQRYFCNIFDAIKLMLPPGTSSEIVSNKVKEKTGRFVYLKQNIEDIECDIDDGKIKSPKQIRVLNFLKDNEGIYSVELQNYTDTTTAILNNLEKKGYIEIIEEQIRRNPFIHKEVKRDSKLTLTKQQQEAFNCVKEKINSNKFEQFLLYGVTGSGKTEVYLQLIEEALKQGKKAIVLVPEISLTPQMVDRFLARFGMQIAVLHSKLSIGERFDEWERIKNNEANIVIGARSAIFAPITNLGIVIIDEEHDSSYKSDMSPRYQAKDIAKYFCKINNVPLVLGSATPDISDFYLAKTGKMKILELTYRANNSNLPSVEIVDLREELASGNKFMISEKLKKEIENNIKDKKQTILFLNRRGFSTFVMCRECGFTAKCKNCNIALTYHKNESKLKCHYCGFETKNITNCPICKSNKIKYFGAGTQKLEQEINEIFPMASTIRMDIDTITKKNSHEEILDKFKKEGIDILIGTQMVVKGHHFPKVTLVGVIAADSSLNIDDFRASERTFQIITQVAGRAGREGLPGKVIIQTYNKDHFAIEHAKKQDYDKFYEDEIKIRKQLKYPPFCDIIVANISSKDEKETKEVSDFLYQNLKKAFPEFENKVLVYKPVPSPINKIKNRYRWRIIIKCKFNNNIMLSINNILDTYYKSKYKKTRVIFDVNPVNMI